MSSRTAPALRKKTTQQVNRAVQSKHSYTIGRWGGSSYEPLAQIPLAVASRQQVDAARFASVAFRWSFPP
jgi:hypothetical protein